MMRFPPRPSRSSLAYLLLLAFGLLIVGYLARGMRAAPAPAEKQDAGWPRVERLIGEQKFQEALQDVEVIRVKAIKDGNEDEWARALIKEVQLRTGLHGWETSVRFLREQPWPKGFLPRTTLNLFYAHSLLIYVQAYSYEIGQREKVQAKGLVDLKAWTREQIVAEAQRAFEEAWQRREELGGVAVGVLSEYMNANDYPPEVRGTLRDAITYMWADLLTDSANWRPEQSNDVFKLDLGALLQDNPGAAGKLQLTDPAVHPLLRVAALLDDLAAFHARRGQRAGDLEAKLDKLRRLSGAFTGTEDHDRIRDALVAMLPNYRGDPWWAMGISFQAELVRNEAGPGNLVRARAIAQQGLEVYPDSVGGRRCLSIVKSIEAPEYQLAAMLSDGSHKRSLQVTSKNLKKLYFRAYRFNLEGRLTSARDYNLLPQGQELQQLLMNKPNTGWAVDLPATPDYKPHHTYVTPPMAGPDTFIVMASAREDFAASENVVVAAFVNVGDLVMESRGDSAGGVEVTVRSGATGMAAPGADVYLYQYDWQHNHHTVASQRSDEHGIAHFPFSELRSGNYHFLLARLGRDLAIDPSYISFSRPQAPYETTASLVYTDRSVYRPMQKIFWKALAYRGSYAEAHFNTLPTTAFTVYLYDANNQIVEQQDVTSNGFGSAAGEFTIPAGRLLGQWRVQTSLSGQAQVQVEEYKRPTFEVSLKDPTTKLRLNQPAALVGEARYYFGLPVTNGKVRWRVNREPVYPWWWGWWWTPVAQQSQVVAAGTADLQSDGTFHIKFKPEADERLGKTSPELSYRYVVNADATDEGGETRSASRSFRLGFVSVEARVDAAVNFFRPGAPAMLTVVRSDLNGTPRAGAGRWRLVALKQPAQALLPADQPLPSPPPGAPTGDAGDPEAATPGDHLRPRWAPAYLPEAVLHQWSDGEKRLEGKLQHDAAGKAEVSLGKLPAGAYRLHYETTDDFGAVFRTSKEFVVAEARSHLALPALLLAESNSASVGDTARFLVHSGLSDQPMVLEIYRAGKRIERRELISGRDPSLIELPVTEEDRGGYTVVLTALRDHQAMTFSQSLFVPWDNRELKISFSTFRDKMRPGAKELWRVTVKGPDGRPVEANAAELLAYMYDRSLDIFAAHNPPSVMALYPSRIGAEWERVSLGQSSAQWVLGNGLASIPYYPSLRGDQLKFYDSYGIGGMGIRGLEGEMRPMPGAPVMTEDARNGAPPPESAVMAKTRNEQGHTTTVDKVAEKTPAAQPAPAMRANFAETAFWQPQLLTSTDGSAAIEFTVPDSVTSWNVWVHAVTRDLRGASLRMETKSVKELMVRPYMPRFLREGDRADIKVVVNNAGTKPLSGRVKLDIIDPDTNKSLLGLFGLGGKGAGPRSFTVKPGGGANVAFPISAPRRVGTVAFRVVAEAADLSDGELRPIPVLPGRLHLAQSRFVTLNNQDRRTMTFEDMTKDKDPSRSTDSLIVTVDAQLFYSVLNALPYLVNYPYECTEQILNRFVSTGIVSSVYKDYPAVAAMAKQMSERTTPLETWDAVDPNRKMTLEETPWLEMAKGGTDAGLGMVNVLDPRAAAAEREASLDKLKKAQTSIGAFPWWPGGPPSPYMTLYIMHGLAKATEFNVDVPKDMVQRGWRYLAEYIRSEDVRSMMAHDCCWEFLTFLNYVATSYPDPSWTADALTPKERLEILNFSFRHWKEHSPYLKGYLALTLKRMGRLKDAQLVFDSVMDSAKTTQDEGTFWAQEDRSWLWYNDTTETHAYALRALMELRPEDARRHGLVQWILLDKKLNHWKSTKATAEVIYSLVKYLKEEGQLGIHETISVKAGPRQQTFEFSPDKFTGKKNQVVIDGPSVDAAPEAMSTVVVEKQTKGFAFASATWHFSTDKLPAEARGDFFNVTRHYFKRDHTTQGFVLKPLEDGTPLAPGDEVEVQLSLQAKHQAEYVHLRDPRGAGFEPVDQTSRFKWDLGIGWYEEIRDSGTNFFFEQLPVGEYTFKYRIRVAMAGNFRVGPAEVQSMYAPEFNAYSAGNMLKVGAGK